MMKFRTRSGWVVTGTVEDYFTRGDGRHMMRIRLQGHCGCVAAPVDALTVELV